MSDSPVYSIYLAFLNEHSIIKLKIIILTFDISPIVVIWVKRKPDELIRYQELFKRYRKWNWIGCRFEQTRRR